MTSANVNQADKNTFIITRTFNAPQELLFKVWTDVNHLQKWMAPKGFTGRYKKAEIRPGGVAHYSMTGPDGKEMWGKVMYKEINSPTKLVYSQCFSDANEGVTRHPMAAEWPLEMLTTILFESVGTKQTKLTLTWVPVKATHAEIEMFIKSMVGMDQGWAGTFEKLDTYLDEVTGN